MIRIFKIEAGYWTGEFREIDVRDPCPPDWTREVPPEGSVARLDGWRWEVASDGEVLAARRTALLAALAGYRYVREIAGTMVGNVTVRTDRESQALVTGAALAAMLDPSYALTWKAVDGWVDLDAASIIAIASAIRAHVQGCFDRERTLAAEIAHAGTVEALEAIDITAGWPGGN